VQIVNTLQGEGRNSGIPVVLVRIAGCNRNCEFCDTPLRSIV